MAISLLDKINSPDDLKKLDDVQTEQLCTEIREVLVDTVSKTGGHLASNLGTVELTVAIHRSFNSPIDGIIFDVGHQCYTHKLLTGRYSKFSTLRLKGGISGFPRPSESEHDCFITGHSSTAISAAYGMLAAKERKKKDGYVVAVVGDGALSGGLAYEALNNVGQSKGKLIVILNDNKMSISRNVGAMSRHLAVIRWRPWYHRVKNRTERIVLKIPLLGKFLHKLLFKIKSAIKSFFFKTTIFEDMGIAYLGPVDGHDLKKLGDIIETAKALKKPVVIHACTVKGKGYSYAEKVPNEFHGVSAFDVDSGEASPPVTSFSAQFGEALCEFAAKDRRICAITAAMTESTGLQRFCETYKSRFFDVGIAEQHAVTFAAGLSAGGMIPVFAVYSTFLQRAYDQVLHDAALQKLKLVLAIDRAGIVGEDGETHQGVFDVPMLNTIPGITVYSPSNFNELRHSLKCALYDDLGVVAVRYPRGGEVGMDDCALATGESFDVYGMDATQICLVTYGREFAYVQKAAEQLREKGVDLKVIKLNRIIPIDENAVLSAMKSKKVFFFEEGMKNGSIAQTFVSLMCEKGYSGKTAVIAIEDFIPQATVKQSLAENGLDSKSIYDYVLGDCR